MRVNAIKWEVPPRPADMRGYRVLEETARVVSLTRNGQYMGLYMADPKAPPRPSSSSASKGAAGS